MRRLMFAAFVLSGAMAAAQDPKPDPPPAPKVAAPAQPNPFARPASAAARVAALEEEVETLEAHRDVRKGYVKAAELDVRIADLEIDRLVDLATRGVVSKSEMQKAKVDLEKAKVQVEIRAAELKEVDVKIKHAKKRLEEAKAPGVRPAPGGRGEPKVGDPRP